LIQKTLLYTGVTFNNSNTVMVRSLAYWNSGVRSWSTNERRRIWTEQKSRRSD